jgi:5-formyltetrahydrofolate cyclo-ligase
MDASKKTLRDRYRHDRELAYLPLSWTHVLDATEFNGAQTIASYVSYEFEPSTVAINNEIMQRGLTLVLPRRLPDNDLTWHRWDGSEERLRKRGKVREPILGDEVEPSEIDIAIVPALHINRAGYRLGQGGGSYDRALSKMSAWSVALIYPHEITSEALPIESHDLPVNAAATPDLLIRFTLPIDG